MKINDKLLTIGLLGLWLAMLGPVRADDEKADETPDIKIFKQLDKNQDGKLIADEISEDKKRFFEQLIRSADANKDGLLEEKEYLNPPKEKPVTNLPLGNGPGGKGGAQRDVGEMFKRADKNGDGKLTLEEMPERLAERLKPLLEKAGKSEVTQQDLEKLMARRGGGANPGKGNPVGGKPGAERMGRPNIEELFEDADTDGDGKILLSDVKDRGRMLVERAYDKLGKDLDEPITLDELKEALPRRPEGGPSGPAGGRPFRNGPEGDDPEMRSNRDGDLPPPFGHPQPPKFVIMLDKDEDGHISKEEFGNLDALFQELDEDEDGVLSIRELMGPPPHEREEFAEGEDMPRRPPGRPEGSNFRQRNRKKPDSGKPIE